MKTRLFSRSTLAAAILVATAGGYVIANGGITTAHAAVPETGAQVTTVPGMAVATDFSGIVEREGPAVVNISVTGKAKAAAPDSDDNGDDDSGSGATPGVPQMSPDDPFYQFFKRFGPQLQIPKKPRLMRAQGSGFIISPDGLILTNAHVVDGASEVTVKLTDRREFKAKVLGSDKQSDIAVIKISATNLPVVNLGDPQKSKVGEPVLAIGSPYGFDNTATAGIISAKSRSLPDDTYVPFIQTDAAVNPGNSGGPLFNIKGEVIGINSQIYSQTGGYQGLAFAIPIDVAVKVKDQLVAHGKVIRGHLGVAVQEMDQGLASSFGLTSPNGALVASVEKDSPADKAGLQVGDVIVSFNGKKIDHSSDLPGTVADIAPGTSATVTYIRDKTQKTAAVKIGDWKTAGTEKTGSSQRSARGRLGLSVRPLTQEERDQSGIESGLLVNSVSGAAAEAGIRAGDVILSFNGVPIKSAEQLSTLVEHAGKNVALLVQRHDGKIFVPLNLQ
jgi:serine protease Do